MSFRHQFCIVTVVAGFAAPALAGGFDSGSDGSDGAFAPASVTVIDLALAEPGSWDSPGGGNGVYDAERWIVVFKYTTIDTVPGLITFLNHPSGAPVVWLAQGDVHLGGLMRLDGEASFANSGPYMFAQGGPGGFSGGGGGFAGFQRGDGFGPGGGTAGGEYAGSYGNESIFPLIGGSGGQAGGGVVGGAGGGAILIASSGTITVNGQIWSLGGSNVPPGAFGGSGGGIRLVANVIDGDGTLTATGGTGGGVGRIRLEAFDLAGFSGESVPPHTVGAPGQLVQDDLTPTVRVSMVDGLPVPLDPVMGVLTKEVVADNGIVTLTIEANNVPPGAVVEVIVTPAHGSSFSVSSTPLSGSTALSTATAIVDLPNFPADIQLRATF